jgi:hypothetical protein
VVRKEEGQGDIMPAIVPGQDPSGIVFANPADLITKALEIASIVGFGRTATSEELLSGMRTLNVMLDEWGTLRNMINVRKSEDFPLIAGQNVYGIGDSSNDFDTVRPIRIEQAFLRDADGTDYPLDVTMLEEEYSAIPIKNTTSRPAQLFYKPDWPLGEITLDYLPDKAYQLFLKEWKPFAKITDPADGTQLGLPDGYESCMMWNLADMLFSLVKGNGVNSFIHQKAMQTMASLSAAYNEAPFAVNWDIPFAGQRGFNPRSLFGDQ